MKYPGGKNGSGVYQTIINHIPPHRVYIEPFLGSGAILRMKAAATCSIGVDLDHHALDSFSSIPIPGLHLINRDALTFLSTYPWTGSEFVYCDPPYLLETRRKKARIYRHEFSSIYQHTSLLRLLQTIPALIMLSGYINPLYHSMLPTWSTISFSATTRGGHVATEVLWMNYPIPTILHDYRYLGRDFRERERIHRRQARWKRRLATMNPLEKAALLSAIRDLDIPSPDKAHDARAPSPQRPPLIRILSPYTTIPPDPPGSKIDSSSDPLLTSPSFPTIDAPGHTPTSDDR